MPSPSHESVIDERGFLFLLPRLGQPVVGGEWHCVKAAIGIKEEALYRLVHDKNLKMPIRYKKDDSVLMPIEVRGSLLILPLLTPSSSAPNAPPEYFSVFARHCPLEASLTSAYTQSKVPDSSDWIIYPMFVYEDMAPTYRAQSTGTSRQGRRQRGGVEYQLEVGTAAQAELWKKEESEEDVDGRGGVIRRKVYVGRNLEAAKGQDSPPSIVLDPEPV